MKLGTKVVAASLLAISAGAASAALIDFESVATGTYSSVTTGGVTFTFTAGTGLFNVDNQTPGPPISGHNLISYFLNAGPGAFQATMAGGFSSFKIGCGDFGASDDDECHLEAFDAAGGLLASSIFSQPAGHPGGGGYMTVASATPIAYVRFYEVGSFAGAVYWDNVTFEPSRVPEPGTLALLGLGLAGLAAARRRKE
jgi:hypothetical protein